MLTYDLRSLVRRYTWTLPLAFVTFCFYTGLLDGALTPRISISMDLPLLGPTRTLYSAGEWGRSILLSLELFLSIPLSALVGFLAVQPLSDEMEHGEVLECTPRATFVPMSMIVTATSLSWLCVVFGGATAFLNPLIRAQCCFAGWSWLPLLLTLAWLRIAVWTTTCALMFYLTGSKWMAIASVPLVQIAWFGFAALGGTGLLAFVHRGLLAWGFLSPYSPFGVSGGHLANQAGMLLGALALLLGCGLWAKSRRITPSVGYRRLALLLTSLGGAFLIASLLIYTSNIQRLIAPAVSANSVAAIDCPTVSTFWTSDGRLVRMPGTYSALRLSSVCETPSWLAMGDEAISIRRFDDLGESLSTANTRQQQSEMSVNESLILAFPMARPIPVEFAHRIELYQERIEPMIGFASSWMPMPMPMSMSMSIILIYPSDMLGFRRLVRIKANEIWIDEESLICLDRKTEGETAWAVAASLGLDDESTAYTALVLASLINPELTTAAIEALRSFSAGEPRTRWTYLPGGMSAFVREEGVAARILAWWDEGEESGHGQLVEQLMQRRSDD